MRAGTHEVTLAGGRLVLPLTMNALRIMGRIAANPLDPKAGPVDPGKVLRGEQDLSTETLLDCLAALGKSTAEDVFAMDNQKALSLGLYKYCLVLMQSMGPERQEEGPPKT